MAVAIGDNEVGIDIELIKPFNENLINKVFSLQEKEQYQKGDIDFFFKIWVNKEAYCKRLGTGLTCYPKDIEVTGFIGSNIIYVDDKRYYLSVSLSKEEEISFHLLDGKFA